jgi:hypothetical protein
LVLFNSAGERVISSHGGNDDVGIGGNGQDGALVFTSVNGKQNIRFNARNGDAVFGGAGAAGSLSVMDQSGKRNIIPDGGSGDIGLGATASIRFDRGSLRELLIRIGPFDSATDAFAFTNYEPQPPCRPPALVRGTARAGCSVRSIAGKCEARQGGSHGL